MTLDNKMSLWTGKTDSVIPQPGSNDLFEGGPEDDDNVEFCDINRYKDAIIKDSSYLWLIASLQA